MKKIILLFLFLICISCKNETKTELNTDVNAIVSDTVATSEDSINVSNQEPIVLRDEEKIKSLKSFFRSKKDEFSANKTEWITPKSAPYFSNRNGIYCYFSENNLRFIFQYHADDWLFINKMQFLIDGKTYEYTPENLKRDNDATGITEWFDDSVNYSNSYIVLALSEAKTAKVKLLGDNYYKVKIISKSQILGIKRTLDYYEALGYKIP